MPSTWFAWGVPLLHRHWSIRWGECPHCGAATFRPSYDASKMVVAFGLPLIPLGKIHVHEECSLCQSKDIHPLDDWEHDREETLIPALNHLAAHPGDPAAITVALQHLVTYGDCQEFQGVAAQIESQASQHADTLSQLAWCHGHFAQFDEATRLYQQAVDLHDTPQRRAVLAAYATLPEASPPSPPNAFLQGLRLLLLPILLIAGLTLYASQAIHRQVSDVYLVNGTDQAYDVLVNSQPHTLPAKGHLQISLPPGQVNIAPPPAQTTFSPYQFVLNAKQGARPVTALINPDKLAVISFEELVFQNTETSAQANADQFELHVGKGFYLFGGITDHFQDPPDALELHSKHEETYRYVIHHLSEESPADLCALLLGQGEIELTRTYCRLRLEHDPASTELLPYLLELAPDNASLALLESHLDARPIQLPWHQNYISLAKQLGSQAAVEAYYIKLAQDAPEDGQLRFLLGHTRADSEQALTDYQRAATYGCAEALLPVSRHLTSIGEFTSALSQIDKALKQQPNNPSFKAQREELLLASGQFTPIIAQVRQALDQDPLNQDAAMTLAGLYEAAGEPQHAQSITDHFIQAVSLDGSLVSEETASTRQVFAGIRAQWAGDIPRFIQIGGAIDDASRINVLILQGKLAEAAASVDRAATDPFLHLLLYALTARSPDQQALAEVQLSQFLTLLEELPSVAAIVSPWFKQGTNSPSLDETLKADLPNYHRRVLLFALAQRHPALASDYLAMAKKINYHRLFPYLALKQALE